MNIEKLSTIARAVSALLAEGNVVASLSTIETALTNQMNSPSESNVATVTTQMDVLAQQLGTEGWQALPRTWLLYLEEIGFTPYFGSYLADRVRQAVGSGGATLTSARDEVVRLRTTVETFKAAFDQLVAATDALGVKEELLQPGQGELAVVLPRQMFGNEIRDFAKQTKELDRIISVITELATGSRESAQIREISTTDPVFFLLMAPIALKYFLETLNALLEAYEKVLTIRKLRAELASAALSRSTLEGIEKDAQQQINAAVAALIPKLLAAAAPAVDEARKNELKSEIERALFRLAGGIDSGMRFEAAIEPPKGAKKGEEETAEQKAVRVLAKEVRTLSIKVRRFELVGEPILNLLPPPANDAEEE